MAKIGAYGMSDGSFSFFFGLISEFSRGQSVHFFTRGVIQKLEEMHTIMLALSSVLDLQNRSSILLMKTKTKEHYDVRNYEN